MANQWTNPWTPFQDAVLTSDYGRVPTRRIAASLGKTFGSTTARVRVLGLRSNLRAKWIGQDLRDAVMLAYCGKTRNEVAAQFGIAATTVRHIIDTERKRAA